MRHPFVKCYRITTTTTTFNSSSTIRRHHCSNFLPNNNRFFAHVFQTHCKRNRRWVKQMSLNKKPLFG
ncbi:hypothetical protein HanIR_Chr17g0876481 [Helianthus annuus]|nr:hypothetical protein HanIR_Chr17g0876481 [Helianthus annuus]